MEKTYKILKLVILVLAFAVVIVGAYVLYDHLGSQVQVGGIVTVAQESTVPEETEEIEAPVETEAPDETEEPVETEESAETEEPEETTSAAEEQPSMAPDFTVYDLEGNAWKLSDFRGKPVLLNFWASWCGPCQMEMPDFQKYYESHGDKVNFVIVNLTDGQQETVESASSFIAEKGYTFPVYYDTDIDAVMKYGIQAVPVSYFIDAEGRFVAWAHGALSADMLQQGMDMVLG